VRAANTGREHRLATSSEPVGRANPHLDQGVVELGAPLARARVVVVLVHGRGQTPDYVRQHVADRIPLDDVAYRLPHAVGGSWYPQRFLAPLAHNEPSLSQALDAIGSLIDSLAAQGVDRRRLALVGFSQGGCLVAEYAVRHPARYAAVVACTGGLIGPPGTTWGGPVTFAGTPVLLTAAEDDPWVPTWRVVETAAVMARMGAVVRQRVFPGADHLVRPEEVAEIATLLASVGVAARLTPCAGRPGAP
jgi:predicted esterase